MKNHVLPISGLILGLATTPLLSGCNQQNKEPLRPDTLSGKAAPQIPIVHSTQVNILDTNRPTVTPGTSRSRAIEVSVIADRDALLNQEYLYGADLQYSSLFDKDLDLYNQSLAIGHIPARFRIVGQELQLIADNKRLYPSDVNHPEQLLSRYKILSQTEAVPPSDGHPGSPATLTLSGANSGLILAQLFSGATQGTTNGALADSAAKPPQDLWIRSFDYVTQGNYMLQQTSIILQDGTIAEFMESIFPRSTLSPGSQFEKFEMDPEDGVGAKSGPVARFRMLPGEKTFSGEKAINYAQHFDISQNSDGTGGTIDFYVTPNIPDEYLEPVQLAVEGWNRYFTRFQGIQRKVLVFKGRLPQGIHLGDPRFNVINWDNRRVAGAAYETQASDPASGKQSHTLIYMPAAWLQLGQDYWKDGQSSDPSPESTTGRFAKKGCSKNVREAMTLTVSGRLSEQEINDFAIQTLKQTLFHEIGHSLGLAHNFKGSLSYDRSNPATPFSTSVMDYNDWELERAAFYSVTSSDGPSLAYDAQALSAIYNHGRDIRSTDPVLPVCNDAEADAEDEGVDPLCIRYDIEKDPTLSLKTAFSRMNEKVLNQDTTLSQAISKVGKSFLENTSTLEEIKTQKELDDFVSNLGTLLQGPIKFYLLEGKASLNRTILANVKVLLMFEKDILPQGYQEFEMRERVYSAVQDALSLKNYPEPVSDAIESVAASALFALESTPYIRSMRQESREASLESIREAIIESARQLITDADHGLPKLHKSILTNLKRNTKVPFYLGSSGSGQIDYESSIMTLLSDFTLDTERSRKERVAAATSLVTYRDRLSIGNQMIKRTLKAVLEERASASTNQERETAEALVSLLLPNGKRSR